MAAVAVAVAVAAAVARRHRLAHGFVHELAATDDGRRRAMGKGQAPWLETTRDDKQASKQGGAGLPCDQGLAQSRPIRTRPSGPWSHLARWLARLPVCGPACLLILHEGKLRLGWRAWAKHPSSTAWPTDRTAYRTGTVSVPMRRPRTTPSAHASTSRVSDSGSLRQAGARTHAWLPIWPLVWLGLAWLLAIPVGPLTHPGRLISSHLISPAPPLSEACGTDGDRRSSASSSPPSPPPSVDRQGRYLSVPHLRGCCEISLARSRAPRRAKQELGDPSRAPRSTTDRGGGGAGNDIV
ncbi:uncharacterized protein PSFLO_01750 [Pseudozyma flocculosa]|uniref:Uncharacterized protein n=1 Tax=Pseudozyma flocculosa TaxID=84751 RepID=A0A5C3EYR2_9BASI|nr:uncharacterized protein PSFLO_01750 [Pseudozyma flocculosa]